MAIKDPDQSNVQKPLPRFGLRATIAIVFGVLVLLYTAGIILGFVPGERKIDAINLAMIALALLCGILLLMPEVFEGLQRLELAGFKLEVRERVNQVVRAASAQDERITQLLLISLSPSIFKHLCGIAMLKEYLYHHEYFHREMNFLKDNGFITHMPQSTSLEFWEGIDDKNLAEIAKPTQTGWLTLQLRREDIPDDLWNDKTNIADEKDLERKDSPADLLAYILVNRDNSDRI